MYRDFFDSPDAEDAKRFNHLQRQVRFKSQKFIKLNIFYQDKPLAAGCAWVHSPTSSASLYSPWGNLGDILSGQSKIFYSKTMTNGGSMVSEFQTKISDLLYKYLADK